MKITKIGDIAMSDGGVLCFSGFEFDASEGGVLDPLAEVVRLAKIAHARLIDVGCSHAELIQMATDGKGRSSVVRKMAQAQLMLAGACEAGLS